MQRTHNPWSVGSNPTGPTNLQLCEPPRPARLSRGFAVSRRRVRTVGPGASPARRNAFDARLPAERRWMRGPPAARGPRCAFWARNRASGALCRGQTAHSPALAGRSRTQGLSPRATPSSPWGRAHPRAFAAGRTPPRRRSCLLIRIPRTASCRAWRRRRPSRGAPCGCPAPPRRRAPSPGCCRRCGWSRAGGPPQSSCGRP